MSTIWLDLFAGMSVFTRSVLYNTLITCLFNDRLCCLRSEAKDILGDDWIQRHRRIVQQNANQYKRVAWAKVSGSAKSLYTILLFFWLHNVRCADLFGPFLGMILFFLCLDHTAV